MLETTQKPHLIGGIHEEEQLLTVGSGGEGELEFVIHCEIHRPVREQRHEGGAEAAVQPLHPFLLSNI